jgi:hypothetical protein
MSHESIGVNIANLEAEQVIAEHGGEEFFHENYGLGREELEQMVTYDGRTASMAKVIMTDGCPVGGKIQEAYVDGGIVAVKEKLQALSMFAPEFTVTISDVTLEREQLKKK